MKRADTGSKFTDLGGDRGELAHESSNVPSASWLAAVPAAAASARRPRSTVAAMGNRLDERKR
jgi:hypothetical protein